MFFGKPKSNVIDWKQRVGSGDQKEVHQDSFYGDGYGGYGQEQIDYGEPVYGGPQYDQTGHGGQPAYDGRQDGSGAGYGYDGYQEAPVYGDTVPGYGGDAGHRQPGGQAGDGQSGLAWDGPLYGASQPEQRQEPRRDGQERREPGRSAEKTGGQPQQVSLQVRTYKDVMAGIEALIENLRLIDEIAWQRAEQGVKEAVNYLREIETHLNGAARAAAIAREAVEKVAGAMEEMKSRRIS